MPIIQEILKKSIDRSINGVVTAENNDEEILFHELDEYVITGEVKKHLYKFFDKYVETLNKPTTQTGIWVSGFFGSGKSHLLKMIGHMLKNDTVKGTKAVEFFNDKLKEDTFLLENIKKSAGISTDVILFNIDNVGDQNARNNKDTIVIAFLKKFNQYLGFSRDDIKVADFEWGLWKKGKFEEFKKIFKEIAGTEWEDARRNLTFEADFFLETIEKLALEGLSVKSAETWLESSRDKSYSPEAFMDILKEYLDIKGKNHRMVFLVDEVGQYIGDNKALMLNLQTVTEQIGDNFKGRIWIGVTSQQDIGSILKEEFKNHTDFSKIQGRFPTMLNLASADIEEVIKKRLLEKQPQDYLELQAFYEKNRINIQNAINFDKTGRTFKLYKDPEDFAETYPFVSYQFSLLQNVFEKVRTMGHSGKHLSQGERSLLSAFQEATKIVKNKELGYLVPFHYFFNSIDQFLEDNARRPIMEAESKRGCSTEDVELLKLLFLLKGQQQVKTNLQNLVSFMVDNVDANVKEIEERVKKSLLKLEKEVLIQKDGDQYMFLTNEEQNIDTEINKEVIDPAEILRKLDTIIFTDLLGKDSIVVPETKAKYNFARYIDDYAPSNKQLDLSITLLTPDSEDYNNLTLFSAGIERNLVIAFPQDIKEVMSEIRQWLRVNAYSGRKNRETTSSQTQAILSVRQTQNIARQKRIKDMCERVITNGDIYIGGHQVTDINTNDFTKFITEALVRSAKFIFSKYSLLKRSYDESKIKELLFTELEGSLVGTESRLDSIENRNAVSDILGKIKRDEASGRQVTLKHIIDAYTPRPYGWTDFSILGLVAELVFYRAIVLIEKGMEITDKKDLVSALTKVQPKHLESITIRVKEEIDPELLEKVNNLVKKLFGQYVNTIEKDPKKDLSGEIRKQYDKAKKIKDEIIRNDYPGKKEISEWLEILDEYINTNKSTVNYLNEFLKAQEDFDEILSRTEKVFTFYDKQKAKFDEARKTLSYVKNNKDFIGTLVSSEAYNSLNAIAESSEPYGEIRKIDEFINEIKHKESEEIEIEKQLVKESAQKKRESLVNAFASNEALVSLVQDKFDKFIESLDTIKDITIFHKSKALSNLEQELRSKFKESIIVKVVDIQNELISKLKDKDDSENISKEISHKFHEIVGQIEGEEKLENIPLYTQTAESEQKQFISAIEGKAPKKQRVSISKPSVKPKINIETEEEVIAYIGELEKEMKDLKEKMLNAIKESKIVDVK